MYAADFDFGDSNPLWYVEKAVFNDIKIRESGRVFARLADLIDPTCTMSCGCGDGYDSTAMYAELVSCSPEDTVACYCHGCGATFRYERDIVPNYCPKCGARVLYDAKEDNHE